MRKLFLSILFCATAVVGMAQTFYTVDGVRYLQRSGEDGVIVARQDRTLSGSVTIPATITVDETTYGVTGIIKSEDSESAGGAAFQDCAIISISFDENANLTELPDHTFSNCTQLGSVHLPSTITRIGEGAFEQCTSLTAVDLPAGLTEIGGSCFAWCSSLATIDLPAGLTRIDGAAFHATGLTEFTIPAGVTSLEPELLSDTKITYLEIPATVKKLGYNFFASNFIDENGQPIRRTVKMGERDCRNIEFTEDDIDSWGWGYLAFGDMTTVDLQVPAGGKVVYQEYMPWMNMNITEYGEDEGPVLTPDQRHVTIDGIIYQLKDGEAAVAIQPATLSGEITLPEKVTYEGTDYPVTSIMGAYWSYRDDNHSGYYTFGGAFSSTAVTKLTVPASVKTINAFACSEAQSLQNVVLPEGLTDIETHAFADCPELTTLNIPSTVALLPSGMIKNCPKLTALTLSEGLNEIGYYALQGTGIETLTIPSTCLLLDYGSLDIPNLKTLYLNVKEASNLKEVWDKEAPVTMNLTVFGEQYLMESVRERLAGVDLIVPLGCSQAYGVNVPWLYFRSITDQGSPCLKLDGEFFSAPAGSFAINTEPEFESHDGTNGETYTQGLNLKEGTEVTFETTGTSLVCVYLFADNNGTVKLDGEEMTEVGDDKSETTHNYRRYDTLVEGAGIHTITCNAYEGDQWPCMFKVEVQNMDGEYYEPQQMAVTIDGVSYVLNTTTNGENEIIRTATIARQNPSLSGDITIPEKVRYAKTTWNGTEWQTEEAHEYTVTGMVDPITDYMGDTVDGAFQDCLITGISLPATLTTLPSGAFQNCRQLKNISLSEGITRIGGGAFAFCSSLEEIYLPETVTDMGGDCIFRLCTSLKKVNIPSQVNYLGGGCFLESGIETFIIPKSITTLAGECFRTDSLKEIKICHENYENGTIHFGEDNFGNVANLTLIVPEGKKESLYSQIYPWKEFGNIIEYVDQEDEHQYNAYRLSYEEADEDEGKTALARHRAPAAQGDNDTNLLGYVASGVAADDMNISLPDRIQRNLYTYLAEWQDKPENMPAADTVLKVILSLMGDVVKDGNLDIYDIVQMATVIIDKDEISDSEQALVEKLGDVNGDGEIDVYDLMAIVQIILSMDEIENE